MRLYTLTKRQFVLVFVGFFSCFVITFIIGLAGMLIFYYILLNAIGHFSIHFYVADRCANTVFSLVFMVRDY